MQKRKLKRKPVQTSKISQTILEFAAPLLQTFLSEGMPQLDQLRDFFMIIITVWNAVVFEQLGKSGDYVTELRTKLSMVPAPMNGLIDILIERKRTKYASDLRLVGDFDVTFPSEGEFVLKAEARMMPGISN